MDEEDFDDLFDEVDLLQGSSQESLTFAAANLRFSDPSNDEDSTQLPASSMSSIEITSDEIHSLQHDKKRDEAESNAKLTPDATGYQDGAQPETLREHEPKESVLRSIEAVFEEIVEALVDERNDPAITLKTRPTRLRKTTKATDSSSLNPPNVNTRRFCFPGKTADEAWRFTVIIRILELVHEALRTNVVLSKRDIYYRDPALFGRQTLVDRYIDDIAFTFCVSRSNLNVTAAAKGLIAGAVRFYRRDGSIVDASSSQEGILIPSLRDILSVNMSAVKWILVIEKEASFRSIAATTFWSTIANEGVILTGKGYPDLATRSLLHFLATPSLRNGYSAPPVYGLVDFDPDGLAILDVYKEGSLALSHENADLRVPQIQWLGLRVEHLESCAGDLHASQGLLALTPRDRKKAIGMLDRYTARDNSGDDLEVLRALQTMLMLNLKAELQLLDARPEGMLELLRSKLSTTLQEGDPRGVEAEVLC